MIYRVGENVKDNTVMWAHIRQTIILGAMLGLVALVVMYLILLKAETEIRLDGTHLTTQPQEIKPRYDSQ